MDDGALKTWILSFTISLIINHLLVFVLVTFHVYGSALLYFVFGIELLILIWMQHARLGTPATRLIADDQQRVRVLIRQVDGIQVPRRWVAQFVMVSAAIMIIIYLERFITADHIFTGWDAIVSYNRWAVEWYKNQFPTWTLSWGVGLRSVQYPQLLPCNISITYAFMGNPTVQLFAKMIMPLFPLTILLAVLDLALRSKNLGLVFSVTTTGALLLWLAGDRMDSGYADIPMACLAFASVYMLLLSKDAASATERNKYLFIGAVLCAGAALTKQPAVYLAAVYPLLSFLLVLDQPADGHIKLKARTVALLYCTSALLIAFWYVFTGTTGLGANILAYVAGAVVHNGRNALERVSFAITSIQTILGPILTYLIIPLGLSFGACHRTLRWLLIGVVIPWFFAWAVLFSYDFRNLALAIPFIGVIAGVGLYEALSGSAATFAINTIRRQWRLAAVPLVLVGVVLGLLYPDRRLVHHQFELQKLIGHQQVNQLLYKYQQTHGFKGIIATDYQLLGYLPGLQQYYKEVPIKGVTLEQFRRIVAELQPAYFLWRRHHADRQIDKYVREKLSSGEYVINFELDGYEMIELRGPGVGHSSRAAQASVADSSQQIP
jgi:hypothetical protein